MKAFKKISLFLAFAMLATTAAIAMNTGKKVEAETIWKGTATGYTAADDFVYQKTGSYVHNWGARDEECVFLTSYADDFYSTTYSFDNLSTKAGSSTISNVPNSALYSSLKQLMSSKQSYQTNYDATRDKFRYTDCVNSNTTYISSFYSGKRISGTWDGGDTWNREHTWPNSKGDLSGNGENDIMMLRPTSKSENSSRGNKAYGEGSGYYDPNGEGQNLRGDCARIVLYVYVRWGCINTGSKYDSEDIFGIDGVIESLDVLLDWMEEDPVDTWEMGRNDAVQSITGTRNVFVDYPEYAWLLFGRDIPEDMCTPSGIAAGGEYVPTPKPDTSESSSSSEDSSTPDDEMTPAEIVDAAYQLSIGETLGEYTLTGVITEVDSWTNPTIVVANKTDKPIYCYYLKDDRFAVGDTITVQGTLKNFNGTVEFDWCTLLHYVAGGDETPDDSSSSYVPDDSSSYEPDDNSSSVLEDNSSSYVPDDSSSSVLEDNASSQPDDDSASYIPDDSSNDKTGESSKEDSSVDNDGHDFSDWVTIKEPSETENGKRMRTCYICGATETEYEPKIYPDDGHNYSEWKLIRRPSETQDGLFMRTCYDCGETQSDVIPKLGADNQTQEKGCQSSVGASLVGFVLAAGAFLALKKGKKED